MLAPFITLEGIEGVGKTTQIAVLCEYLESKGIQLATTREPGGSPMGEAVRELLLAPEYPAMHADTELLLMFAARAEHLRHHILPLLEKGTWVICDRFTDSTYAYQGGGRGIPFERIRQLAEWVQGNLNPDLTILLDADIETSLKRTQTRGRADRFEQEALIFFHRVRETYLQRALMQPKRCRIIDANQSFTQVAADIQRCLEDFITERTDSSLKPNQ